MLKGRQPLTEDEFEELEEQERMGKYASDFPTCFFEILYEVGYTICVKCESFLQLMK